MTEINYAAAAIRLEQVINWRSRINGHSPKQCHAMQDHFHGHDKYAKVSGSSFSFIKTYLQWWALENHKTHHEQILQQDKIFRLLYHPKGLV